MTALLQVSGLSKSYSGVRAVDDCSFCVEAGRITGLIGPNGSGKSTTIDCVSGFQRLDKGLVLLDGADITGLSPQRIARAGLVRTFQTVRAYEAFSVLDNLLIGAKFFEGLGWPDLLLRTPRFRQARQRAEGRARDLIALVGLSRHVDAPAAVLSYGQKKLLALAAAIMSDPKLVVLDEPVAGVNPSRINEIAGILRDANRAGTSFLIVEHNVIFIRSLCDRVIVLNQGRKLMEGLPDEVHSDPRVLSVYLGVERGRDPHLVSG